MARVTHVKKAQQRYKTVPVLDANGDQKVIPVLKRNGEPKTTKKGIAITRRLTEPDKTQPKPNRKCDKCSVEIKVGDPYKWIAPKSGPYGGTKRYRCGTCPVWHLWEYNHSRGAQVSRIQYEYSDSIGGCDSVDDIKAVLEEAAGEIEGLADEAEEGANNIEEGFGHETSQSQELMEQSESLRSWAEELTEWESDSEEPEESDIEVDPESEDTLEDLLAEAIEEWIESARSSASDVLDNSPV